MNTAGMNITLTNKAPQEVDADAVVVGLTEDRTLDEMLQGLDGALQGALTRLIDLQEVTGKAGELVRLAMLPGLVAPRLVVVGLGKRDHVGPMTAFRWAAQAAKQLATKQLDRVAYYVPSRWDPSLIEAALCGAMTGCVGQDLFRTAKKLFPFQELVWSRAEASTIHSGWILAEATNLARRLVNGPPSEIYPESFADEAERVAADIGLEVEVWDERRLDEEKCGSMLAVARGSVKPPRLVILRHAGGAVDQPPLALVGKGVTFDSGGLSIKDTENMKTMKCDMAGAATVLAAMQAIARLKVPMNVIGLCGLVENMVSGDSFKLGDILQARSGKTIEVLNTDAEGRLVLADVLDVAISAGAEKIVDLATLTGACMIALGRDVAGIMTNNQPWCDQVLSAARKCGEPLWQLPMFPEYTEHISSGIADIKNVGDGRWGGAITAAKFLEEFVGGAPWVHLDIAGPAFLDQAKPWLDAGGSGVFVRTLVELARSQADAR